MTDDRLNPVVRRDRFSGGPARSFLSSMATDEHLFAADLAVDRAHVVMLEETGVLDAAAAAAILDGLAAVEAAGYDALSEAEDVHEAIETALIEEIGDVGGKLHTARSRNDEVATCIRYRLREDLSALAEAVIEARESLAGVADDHLETVMPGYTHLQPAQPTTVAHWAVSYERALARDTDRLIAAYDRANRSPLGAAAFAGTPYPVDPDRTASLLGFDGPMVNAMDAVSSRDVVLEAVAVASSVAVTLSGLAEDLIIFANRGFVTLDDDYASTSSIMPQKKNPDTLELVRATAGDLVGAQTAVATILKGLPRAYNRDLQSVTPQLLAGLVAVTEATTVAAGAVETATWAPTSLTDAATEGLPTATDVADHLAMAGLSFRTAHGLVADAAATADGDAGVFADAVVAAAAEHDFELQRETVDDLLDPDSSVRRRASPGGPAPSSVREQLETVDRGIDTHRDELAGREGAVAAAERARQAEVDRRV